MQGYTHSIFKKVVGWNPCDLSFNLSYHTTPSSFLVESPYPHATNHQNSKLNIVLHWSKSTILLPIPWWCKRLFSASRSPIVANEGVSESPRPPGSRATITGMSRGWQPTLRGRFPREHAYHGNMMHALPGTRPHDGGSTLN